MDPPTSSEAGTPSPTADGKGLHAIAVSVYALSTLALLLPSVGRAPQGVGPNLGDPLLNVYFLEWGAHQIAQGLPDPWNAPFFYPTPRVLTLSDHLLGPAAAFLGLRALGLPPPAAYNVLLAATFVLGGWTAFWVLRRSSLSPAGALVGGWTFAFSGFRWSQVGYYQALRMQWIPAVLWTFDRLLDRPTAGRAIVFVVFYALHVSGGAYLAFLIHFPLAVLLVNRWLAQAGPFLTRAGLVVWAPTATAALCVLAAFYAPYLETGVPLEARHSVDELWRHGATLASFVTPSSLSLESQLLPFLPRESGRGALFPGIATLGLAALALWPRGGGRAAPRAPDPWRRGLLTSGLVMLLLCLPLLFGVAWSIVPGMRSLRVPVRAFVFATFPLAFLVGLGWDRLAARAARRKTAAGLLAAALLALVVEALPRLPAWQPVPWPRDFPAYACWIAAHSEVRAYLELPLGREAYWETVPMYLQTLHWRPLANGYSAVLPGSFQEISRLCPPFPDAAGLDRLARMGITHVVVHRRSPDWHPGPPTRARVRRFQEGFEAALRESGARRVFADADTEVHAIAPPRGDEP